MPLILSTLSSSLESNWLGSSADSANVSGSRFAQDVSGWFASAQAAGIPCATAKARESQLSSLATAAFQAKSAAGAGQLLATAMLGYIAGQSFGPGTATAPIAFAAGASLFTTVFSDHQMDTGQRAQLVATGCTVMAASTLVVLPIPPYVTPIT